MVKALSSAGVAIHILGTDGVHNSAMGLPVKSVVLKPKRTPISRLLRRRREIDEFSARTGAHVVHLEAPPFITTSSVPTIATVHDLRHFYPSSRSLFTGEAFYQLLFLRSHLRKFRMVFALSPWGSHELNRLLGFDSSKIRVIPPIVETPVLTTADNFIPRNERKYALALGHIERRKNLGVLIAASAEASWPENVDLLVAGRDHGALEELAELNCSLGGKAIFIGGVSDDEKWALLRGANVVLLPSTIEGFGILGTEAPAAESPVLVSNTSSLIDLSCDARALLDQDKPAEWARTVSAIALDSNLSRQIVQAQQRNLETFSTTSVLKLLFDSYRFLIGPPHAAEQK